MARRSSLDLHFEQDDDANGEPYASQPDPLDGAVDYGDDDALFDDELRYPEEGDGGAGPSGAEATAPLDASLDPSALLQESISAGGVLCTYADRGKRDVRVHESRVAERMRGLKASAAEAEAAAEVACRQERTEVERLNSLREVTAAREADLAALRALGLPNLAEQRAAEGRLGEAEAAEAEGAARAEAAFEAARARESERDALFLDLTHTRQDWEGIAPHAQAEAEAGRLAAPRRAAREARAAAKIVEGARQVEAMALAAHEERRQVAASQLDAARKGHRRAVLTLRERVAAERAAAASVDEGRSEHLDARTRAVVALKESTAAAAAELRSANAKRAERLDGLQRARQEEKTAILARGGNPYQARHALRAPRPPRATRAARTRARTRAHTHTHMSA